MTDHNRGIIGAIEELLLYYERNRGTGHTTAALDGVRNCTNAKLVTRTVHEAEVINHVYPNTAVGVSSLNSLMSRQCAIVLDNHFLTEMFREVLRKVRTLEEQVEQKVELEFRVLKLLRVVDRLEADLALMRWEASLSDMK
uniref:Uncharacterized protein n=1 Tax=viral metagenome TaxID=1070528 RepID=A0A6M3LUU6_9ZZZZ